MAINVLKSKCLALALLPLCAIAGCCCQAYPLPGECDCPTDARQLYFATGEEAVRRCPCGPDQQYYGLKPTSWRAWPAGWRCNTCSTFPDTAGYEERDSAQPVAPESDYPNPFRSKGTTGAQPQPSAPAEMLPTPPAAAVKAPAAATPIQKAPAATDLFLPQQPAQLNAPPTNTKPAPPQAAPVAKPPTPPPATTNPQEPAPKTSDVREIKPIEEVARQLQLNAPNLSNRVEEHLNNNLRM